MNERELGGAHGAPASQRATQDNRLNYWRGSWGTGDTTFGDAAPRRARAVGHDELGAALLVALGLVLAGLKLWLDVGR